MQAPHSKHHESRGGQAAGKATAKATPSATPAVQAPASGGAAPVGRNQKPSVSRSAAAQEDRDILRQLLKGHSSYNMTSAAAAEVAGRCPTSTEATGTGSGGAAASGQATASGAAVHVVGNQQATTGKPSQELKPAMLQEIKQASAHAKTPAGGAAGAAQAQELQQQNQQQQKEQKQQQQQQKKQEQKGQQQQKQQQQKEKQQQKEQRQNEQQSCLDPLAGPSKASHRSQPKRVLLREQARLLFNQVCFCVGV